MVVLVGQEVQALMDTASDLNLIRKDIADNLRLRPLFLARATTQAGGILLKTYSVFHERLQITDLFGAYFDAQDPGPTLASTLQPHPEFRSYDHPVARFYLHRH